MASICLEKEEIIPFIPMKPKQSPSKDIELLIESQQMLYVSKQELIQSFKRFSIR